ncbi:hypothetical protein BHM03_00034814, partial [Ensete ventricosum]
VRQPIQGIQNIGMIGSLSTTTQIRPGGATGPPQQRFVQPTSRAASPSANQTLGSQVIMHPVVGTDAAESGDHILGKRSIRELVSQIDPSEKLDSEVEDVLVEIAEDFVESFTNDIHKERLAVVLAGNVKKIKKSMAATGDAANAKNASGGPAAASSKSHAPKAPAIGSPKA